MSPTLTFVGPLALGLLALWIAYHLDVLPDQLGLSVIATTIGTICIGYGVREYLRATGGGYYCCNHEMYQLLGILVTAVGWAVLLVGLAPFLDRTR